jgi:hypothetical protein
MDKRSRLILTRAKELLAREHPGSGWGDEITGLDTRAMERQAAYLSRAEHQLLDEGRIQCVDQS